MNNKKFHEYIYNIENWVDEFAIAFLSFGTIVVLIYEIFFVSSQGLNFQSLGLTIEPWVTMLALMIIARELWIMNRHNQIQSEGE
jgi:hypothetical protein